MQTMYLINPLQDGERGWRLTYTDARSVLACSHEVKRLPGCLPVFGSSFFVVGVIFLADNREANKWHEWEGPFDKETRETSTWAAMCTETDDEWCGRWTRSAQAGGTGLAWRAWPKNRSARVVLWGRSSLQSTLRKWTGCVAQHDFVATINDEEKAWSFVRGKWQEACVTRKEKEQRRQTTREEGARAVDASRRLGRQAQVRIKI